MTNAMMSRSGPMLADNHLMAREVRPVSKQPLSLDSSAMADIPGLHPKPFKVSGLSPTSKFHFQALPEEVRAINAADTTRVREFLESSAKVLVVDVRPFNLFSASHLTSSVNICVPSTLLKRPKYDLQHVINASNLPTFLKFAVLDKDTTMKVILYDSHSIDSQVSFQLYHTMLKFLSHPRLELFYIRGGVDQVDRLLFESSLVLSLSSSEASATPSSPEPDKDHHVLLNSPHHQAPTSGNNRMPFLTGFSLPSATSHDSRLLMSIKKNPPKLDTVTSHTYNFRFPENFEEKKSRLPNWLSFFAEVYGVDTGRQHIVERFSKMFNRLEKAEQVRLRMATSGIDKDSEFCRKMDKTLHDDKGYGTPLALCPCCDKIEYTIPKGVEYGYKNRYSNIWPYEHSRVHLISSPSCPRKQDSNDDYFNANYISFKRLSKRGYIATQNPLAATKDDFWTTVWYNGVKAIICLAISPVFGEQAYYECDQVLDKSRLAIKIKSCEQYSSFTLREITLSKNGKRETVYHFAYQKWPDFGTPVELNSVFDLMKAKDQRLASMQDLKQSPPRTADDWDVLVHCSAGCGRTGCYITMDMVADSFENPNDCEKHYDPWGDDDLVYKSVQFQRQQRISMVQNLDQFIFCYESILNYVVTNLIK